MMAGNVTVDVVFYNCMHDWTALGHKGLLKDLSGYLARDRAVLRDQDFFPGTFTFDKVNGTLFGIGTNTGAPAGFGYNMDLLDQAGLAMPPTRWGHPSWTWDSFLSYVRKLTKRDAAGRVQQLGAWAVWPHGSQIVEGLGGVWFTPEQVQGGVAHQAKLVNDQNIWAYGQLEEFVRNWQPDLGWNELQEWWSSGRIGLMNDGLLWAVKDSSHRFGMTGLPYAQGFEPYGVAWFERFGIACTSRYPDEAWVFMRWYLTELPRGYPNLVVQPGVRFSTHMMDAERMTRHFPIGMSVAQLNEYVFSSFDYWHPMPHTVILGGHIFWDEMNRLVPPITGGQISVEAGLQRAEEVINAKLGEFYSQLDGR